MTDTESSYQVNLPNITANNMVEGHHNLQVSNKGPQLYKDWRNSQGKLANTQSPNLPFSKGIGSPVETLLVWWAS